MELIESIEQINSSLVREFGKEFNGEPRFRVVFSEDQYEKRLTDFTDFGFKLLVPEVRVLPKYHYIHQRYVLERLIPVLGETDLVTNISYEPAWVFQDSDGNYLPPRFDACRFVIETIYSQLNSDGMYTKYKDPLDDAEIRKQRILDTEKELFGNETPVGDALAHKYGVVVPTAFNANAPGDN